MKNIFILIKPGDNLEKYIRNCYLVLKDFDINIVDKQIVLCTKSYLTSYIQLDEQNNKFIENNIFDDIVNKNIGILICNSTNEVDLIKINEKLINNIGDDMDDIIITYNDEINQKQRDNFYLHYNKANI